MNDLDFIFRLVDTLGPSRADVIIVGGWAHRLMPLHPLATRALDVLTTRDVDLLIEPGAAGLGERLRSAGFEQHMKMGDERPPISHYLQKENPGAPVEFIALEKRTRKGTAPTREISGVSAQTIRGLELLLVEPWSIALSDPERTAASPLEIRIPNPISFAAHKLLIARKRPEKAKRDKDVLYAYDTLSIFAGQDAVLAQCGVSVRAGFSRDQLKHITSILTDMTSATDAVQGAVQVARATGRPNTPLAGQISATLTGALRRYLSL